MPTSASPPPPDTRHYPPHPRPQCCSPARTGAPTGCATGCCGHRPGSACAWSKTPNPDPENPADSAADSADGGYEFTALGDHDADIDQLAAALHTEAAAEIARCYLEREHHHQPHHEDVRWQVADLEVAGRLTHDPDATGDGPHGVIVDGRFLTWHQLGQALSSFEGWRFRLLIDDPCLDLRT